MLHFMTDFEMHMVHLLAVYYVRLACTASAVACSAYGTPKSALPTALAQGAQDFPAPAA